MIIANISQSSLNFEMPSAVDSLVGFGMMLYMFVLGLELDPNVLIKKPEREAKVAYGGMISTFILAYIVTPYLHYSQVPSTGFNLALSITVSGTASPLLSRIVTDLKIGKSDIGHLVSAAGIHTDMVSTLIISVGFMILDADKSLSIRDSHRILFTCCTLVIQTVFAATVSPVFFAWVNHENPEGKPVKGSHLVVTIGFVVVICVSSAAISGYSPMMSAYVTGLVLPREGRLSKLMINKINHFLTKIIFPIYGLWVFWVAGFHEFQLGKLGTWGRLFLLMVIAMLGKVIGTIASGVMLGFQLPESVAIGLLLTVKGHFHMLLATTAIQKEIITASTGLVMILTSMLTIIHTPKVIEHIIKRARKHTPRHRKTLQWLEPSTELRIMICIRGPQNVSSTIRLIEMSQGTPNLGLAIYVTDMIELTEKVAATAVNGEGMNTLTVMNKSVRQMREQITGEIEAYMAENGEGVTIRRMMALSMLTRMHQDICVLAKDLMVSLIILPFHKNRREDGKFDGSGLSGFRNVNRKVLRHAPCSVGILVDRGLGSTKRMSRSFESLNIAVIFMGGKDDREALSYSSCVARHPGVRLTVIRLLLDTNANNSSTSAGKKWFKHTEQEEEMKLDDEYFTEFYDKHVAGGKVAYTERHLINSAAALSTLQSLDKQYALIIVGRGGGVNSTLTVGMSDWRESPELGPIGDILSASDSPVTASILIIQQHSIKGEIDGLDDDFSIM
ncbi:hypothetical protein VitviT2T_020566 [Vitis vinifera]|nr:cation/H(+) antiporter 28 [Vitis vinifera]WKA02369.1 hypothetical protein VitviT2T_020566 [Vitis vinifera]